MPGKVNVWIMAVRPKTLWAAASPVLIGVALAVRAGVVHPGVAVLTLIAAILIQIGTNLFNDYKDFVRGADTNVRKGPTRVVHAGLVSPKNMKRATVIAFSLAVLAGLYLMIRGGWPIVLIGVSSILFGVLYTAGKYSLANLGLADIFVFIFFGPVAVAGTYYVQALEWPPSVWLAGIAPGVLSIAILLVNNIRDMDEDRDHLKRTVVVRFGRRFGYSSYVGCILIAALTPVVLYFSYGAPLGSLAGALIIPIAIPTTKTLITTPVERIEDLNRVLEATGKLLLVYSLLFSLGWIASP
ncbi:MAG: 1,4-dihydroxy-2-naphthoate polyprenyltransferase [Rhodothermia bacterium]|nr:MAG: 1,4-dihydroxy-2-naphthoate polyprenyltransferase [Rhodothermia bacterium]